MLRSEPPENEELQRQALALFGQIVSSLLWEMRHNNRSAGGRTDTYVVWEEMTRRIAEYAYDVIPEKDSLPLIDHLIERDLL